MKLFVVIYPEISATDLAKIQECRQAHDYLYKKIDPHFTLVFAVEDMPADDFVAEIRKQSRNAKPFSFTIRCATINKDAFTERNFAFLVPDEGFSNILKLHDQLYADKLAHHHRMDIDFIPHIEIANSEDKWAIKGIVDTWNSTDFEISGRVSSITVICNGPLAFGTVEQIRLGEI